jgi:hypothetical protein
LEFAKGLESSGAGRLLDTAAAYWERCAEASEVLNRFDDAARFRDRAAALLERISRENI